VAIWTKEQAEFNNLSRATGITRSQSLQSEILWQFDSFVSGP